MEFEFHAEYIAIVVAMVEFLKVWGVNGKWSALAGFLLGVGVSLGVDFAPDAMQYVIRALLLGLSVPGFYRLGKRAGTAAIDALKA